MNPAKQLRVVSIAGAALLAGLALARIGTADSRLTADGVQCNDSNFELNELSPSVFSANSFRLTRLLTLQQRVVALCDDLGALKSKEACDPARQQIPGMGTVTTWRAASGGATWPTQEDPKYIYTRAVMLRREDALDGESRRALAHLACLRLFGFAEPKPDDLADNEPPARGLTDCALLADAEVKVDPLLEAASWRVAGATLQSTKEQTSKTAKNPKEDLTKAQKEATNAKATLDAADMEAEVTLSQTKKDWASEAAIKARKEAWEKWKQAEGKVAEARANVEKDESQTKTDNDPATAKAVADLVRSGARWVVGTDWPPPSVGETAKIPDARDVKDAKATAGSGYLDQQAYVFYACLNQLMTGPVDAACTLVFPGKAHTWPRMTADVFAAVRQVVPFVAPKLPAIAAEPRSERAALTANFAACPNADVYVTPTHDLVRHSVDEVVGEHFSVCVDTASFAVDQPVQLILSTPGAQQVEWLWPGEPTDVHLETSMLSQTQVVHMVIGGYPRRELLRDLARRSGGPLATEDIFELAEENSSDARSAEQAANTASLNKSLKSFAGRLLQDNTFELRLACLDELVRVQTGAQRRPDASCERVDDDLQLERYRFEETFSRESPGDTAPENVRAASSLLLKQVTSDAKSEAPAVLKALKLPEEKEVVYATTSRLMKIATQLVGLVDTLNPGEQDGATATPASPKKPPIADVLCSLTSSIVPLVSEDILVRGRGEHIDPYVLEYDFGGGFLHATPGLLWEDHPIFVVVRNVAPGWSISVDTGKGTVVQRDLTLVGLTNSADPGGEIHTGESRDSFTSILPLSREMQPPSTHILSIGYPSGDVRRDVTVCASKGGSGCPVGATSENSGAIAGGPKPAQPATPAVPAQTTVVGQADANSASIAATNVPKPAAAKGNETDETRATSGPAVRDTQPVWRLLGKNTVVVHRRHYLGVRAGLGAAWSFGGFQTLENDPSVGKQVVQHSKTDTDWALPLLLAWYPRGRDATEMPEKFSFGFSGGLDLLKIGTTPRLYGGVVFDFDGFGITAAMSTERAAYVVGNVNDFYDSSATAPTVNVWRPGVFLGLTTDLDIFEAVYRSYFDKANFPVISGTKTP
jgi:hypothetical protein